jgi:hypothetical protein
LGEVVGHKNGVRSSTEIHVNADASEKPSRLPRISAATLRLSRGAQFEIYSMARSTPEI